MSIATRITSMEEHIEQAYDELQGLGADLTNVNKNIENISSVLDDIYDSLPSVSGEGTSLTLDDTRVGKIKSTLKGNTSQDGTPTPSSPIPVNVVSGDNEINVVGKNLLNKELVDDSWRNVNTSTQLSTGIKVTCKEQGGYRWSVIPIPNSNYLLGKTLTVSSNITRSGSNQAQFSVQFYNNQSLVQEIAIKSSTSSSLTLTFNVPSSMPSNATGIALVVYSTVSTTANVGDYVEYKDLQLEIGSTASTYEPYQGNTYNIDLPVENLFNKSIATTGKGVNVNTGALYNETATFATDYIEIQNNATYIPSGYSSSVNRVYGAIYDSDKSYLEGISTDIGTKKFTISNANAKYIRLTGFVSEIDTWQLEKGSKQNTYTPYGTTPIELCKIGTYQDYFYKDSGKWYLHKEIGKVVLNGSESGWGTSGTNVSGENRFANSLLSSLVLKPSSSSDIAKAISNLFICTNANQNYSQTQGFCFNSSGTLYIFEPTQKSNTLAQFQTWLSANNITLYYALATSTNTEITDTNLLSQLNAIEQAQSKENQTNISQVNNDLPFIISASALKEWSV